MRGADRYQPPDALMLKTSFIIGGKQAFSPFSEVLCGTLFFTKAQLAAQGDPGEFPQIGNRIPLWIVTENAEAWP